MNKPNPRTSIVKVRVTEETLAAITAAISLGHCDTAASFVRDAIREKLERADTPTDTDRKLTHFTILAATLSALRVDPALAGKSIRQAAARLKTEGIDYPQRVLDYCDQKQATPRAKGGEK